MIFVVDDDLNVSCGKTLTEAIVSYEEEYDYQSILELKVYEGTEMQVTYTLTPKAKKGK